MSIYVERQGMEVVIDPDMTKWAGHNVYTLEYGPWKEGYFCSIDKNTIYLDTMNDLAGYFRVVYTNSFGCEYDNKKE